MFKCNLFVKFENVLFKIIFSNNKKKMDIRIEIQTINKRRLIRIIECQFMFLSSGLFFFVLNKLHQLMGDIVVR